jgi:hypothetical protein
MGSQITLSLLIEADEYVETCPLPALLTHGAPRGLLQRCGAAHVAEQGHSEKIEDFPPEVICVKFRGSITSHSVVCFLIAGRLAIACMWRKVPTLNVDRTDHVSRTDGPCRILSGS